MARSEVVVPGGRLAVVDEGSGPPIVLLHAGIVDARAWDPLVPYLVEAGYRAVRLDFRGSGGSTTEDVEFSHRADVIAVLDALGIGRVCLVGNSRGGQIAVDTAVESPDRVAALVTLGANIGGYEPEPTPQEAALFTEMERLEEGGGDPEIVADFDVRLWVDGIGQSPDRVPAGIREAVRLMDRQVADPTRVRGRPIRLDPPAAVATRRPDDADPGDRRRARRLGRVGDGAASRAHLSRRPGRPPCGRRPHDRHGGPGDRRLAHRGAHPAARSVRLGPRPRVRERRRHRAGTDRGPQASFTAAYQTRSATSVMSSPIRANRR